MWLAGRRWNSVWRWFEPDLDRDAEHEAEQKLVLLKQAAADVTVEGVRHILH